MKILKTKDEVLRRSYTIEIFICVLFVCCIGILIHQANQINEVKAHQKPTLYVRKSVQIPTTPKTNNEDIPTIETISRSYEDSNITTMEMTRNSKYDELLYKNTQRKLYEQKKNNGEKVKKERVTNDKYIKYKLNNYIGVNIGTHQLPSAVNDYDSIISYWANYYNLNKSIVKAMIAQESSGDADNNSGSGWGLMQIENTVLSEFKNYGQNMFNESWSSNDRLNPNKNISFGCYRIRQNLEHYKGDYMKAIQAYNFSHYSLDKLIDAFGSDWYNHREEMAYYNGHYNRTGSTRYGDPNYIENVLKFFK